MKDSSWDVFISHASEDKDTIARPLAERLRSLGLHVWYDEFELQVGDSLSRSIDRGLAESEHGVVVLSDAFFRKDWPEYELRGLIAKTIGRDARILPLWHGVGRDEVLAYSPSLADVVAEGTDQPLTNLALKVVKVVRPQLHLAILRKIAYLRQRAASPTKMMPLSALKKSPIRHASLPAPLEARVRNIREALYEVYPLTTKEWMEGLQRDMIPREEIEVWEGIAGRYAAAKEQVDLSLEERKSLFGGLLLASVGDNEGAAAKFLELQPGKLDLTLAAMAPDPSIFVHEETSDADDEDAAVLFGQEVSTGDAAKVDDDLLKILAKKNPSAPTD